MSNGKSRNGESGLVGGIIEEIEEGLNKTVRFIQGDRSIDISEKEKKSIKDMFLAESGVAWSVVGKSKIGRDERGAFVGIVMAVLDCERGHEDVARLTMKIRDAREADRIPLVMMHSLAEIIASRIHAIEHHGAGDAEMPHLPTIAPTNPEDVN